MEAHWTPGAGTPWPACGAPAGPQPRSWKRWVGGSEAAEAVSPLGRHHRRLLEHRAASTELHCRLANTLFAHVCGAPACAQPQRTAGPSGRAWAWGSSRERTAQARGLALAVACRCWELLRAGKAELAPPRCPGPAAPMGRVHLGMCAFSGQAAVQLQGYGAEPDPTPGLSRLPSLPWATHPLPGRACTRQLLKWRVAHGREEAPTRVTPGLLNFARLLPHGVRGRGGQLQCGMLPDCGGCGGDSSSAARFGNRCGPLSQDLVLATEPQK